MAGELGKSRNPTAARSPRATAIEGFEVRISRTTMSARELRSWMSPLPARRQSRG
jgi:hypothetical protein